MRKLTLESLQVESFETTPHAVTDRGTVQAHQDVLPSPPSFVPSLETYDVQACGDTRYFDCTYGCSVNTDCAYTCGLTVQDCV